MSQTDRPRSLIQDHLGACLTRALTASEPHDQYDPTTQEQFRALTVLFEAGEVFDPSIPLFGEHGRHESILESLDSELEHVMQTGTTSEVVRMEKTVRAFLVLAARHGWDPVLDPGLYMLISPGIQARQAIVEGHRQALERIAATATTRAPHPGRRF